MRSCNRCGKGVQVGMNVSHSHIRTKKRSYPNLHNLKIKEAGVTRRVRLCTKCLRLVKKEQKKGGVVKKEVVAQEPVKSPA